MEEDKLKEIIATAIEPKLKEQFTLGLMAGWSACAESLYKQASTMTSAKDIKSMLKEEANKRHIMASPDELNKNEDSD